MVNITTFSSETWQSKEAFVRHNTIRLHTDISNLYPRRFAAYIIYEYWPEILLRPLIDVSNCIKPDLRYVYPCSSFKCPETKIVEANKWVAMHMVFIECSQLCDHSTLGLNPGKFKMGIGSFFTHVFTLYGAPAIYIGGHAWRRVIGHWTSTGKQCAN